MVAWVPMISSTDFTGIQVDVGTVATGLVTIALSIVGVFYVIRAMRS